jgi:predicted O-methyltransferase YrrM
MFGIYGPLKKKASIILRTIFYTGESSPVNIEYQALYPHILSDADAIFSNFFIQDKPSNKFKKLLRENGKNSSSVDKDSAYILYYISKIIKAKTAIEVGIYRGAGSLHLAQAISENGGGELHLVELSSDYMTDVQSKIKKSNLKINVISHCGRSDDKQILSDLPKADIIFLDADHTYNGVKPDFDNYWPLLKNGGVLLIHDTVMWPGTRKLANELFTHGYPITTLATNGGAGISILRKKD